MAFSGKNRASTCSTLDRLRVIEELICLIVFSHEEHGAKQAKIRVRLIPDNGPAEDVIP